jgi:hypothetical protein
VFEGRRQRRDGGRHRCSFTGCDNNALLSSNMDSTQQTKTM